MEPEYLFQEIDKLNRGMFVIKQFRKRFKKYQETYDANIKKFFIEHDIELVNIIQQAKKKLW